ncbi:TPA: hypothetical protein ACU6IV_004529 [Pseudomonas aeruginosa]
MSIADNGQLIGFRSLMGSFPMGSHRDQLLTEEGMAEHFWESFMRPLQQRIR